MTIACTLPSTKPSRRVNDVSGLIVELKSMTVASPALNTPGLLPALLASVLSALQQATPESLQP